MNKSLKEIHENIIEWIERPLKRKYKEIQKNKTKQVKEMNKTVQDLKMEIEAIKKNTN